MRRVGTNFDGGGGKGNEHKFSLDVRRVSADLSGGVGGVSAYLAEEGQGSECRFSEREAGRW